MGSMMNKPIEYWIKFKIGGQLPTHQIVDVSMNTLNDSIHVIEYSAYEKIKSELKLNADLLADCKLMREALKFYSLKSNYSLVDEGRNYDVDYKCYELNEKTYGDEDLGTKARQVLSQLKGKYDE